MKPENRFIANVHKKLPAEVYREKMHNPYRGGTFDVWYSGSKADLWIEYKWIDRIPKRGRVIPDLSALQMKWGKGRYAEGRHVLVVVGCPGGAVMFRSPRLWEAGVTAEEFRRALVTKPALVAWVHSHVVKSNDAADKEASGSSKRGVLRVQDTRPGVPDLRAGQVQDEEEDDRPY